MNLLGIDVGYDRCGYAVFSLKDDSIIDSNVITTDPNDLFQKRVSKLRKDLMLLKKQFKPVALSLELLFFYRRNKVFEKICMTKGVVVEVFSDIQMLEFEPSKIKKLITGMGNAKKKDIRKFILSSIQNYSLRSKYDDELDAIALVLILKKNLSLK